MAKTAGAPLAAVGEDDTSDDIARPAWYRFGEVELIDLLVHFDWLHGSLLKYAARAGRKPGSTKLEDLLKAQQILTRLIEREQGGGDG